MEPYVISEKTMSEHGYKWRQPLFCPMREIENIPRETRLSTLFAHALIKRA
jgi:hypothetical protein